MNVRFLRKSDKKELIEKTKEQFGIEELPYLLFETGKEKIRGFSGTLTEDQLKELGSILNVEIIGLYLIRKEHDYRLSFDATQMLAPIITKNIVDITEEQLKEWIRGKDLAMQAPRGTVVLRQGTDFVGCGKSTGVSIINHVPKERRIRK